MQHNIEDEIVKGYYRDFPSKNIAVVGIFVISKRINI